MALASFAANVTMSAKDINEELGISITSMLDFQGAAASFSGIIDTETTEGFGAEAIEMKEFYGKTFSAGSGTYGTRNTHTIKYLTDAGAAQAWSSNQLIQCAENSNTNMSADTGFSARTETYHVDDYIDNDLTNGDIFFINATGTGKFDGTSAAVDSGGDGSRFYFDDTADDIVQVSSTGVASNVRSITPSVLTLSLVSKDDDEITVRATGNTQVTRTIRFYKDGSSVATKTADGGGGSDFNGGGVDDTSRTQDFTFSSLASSTAFALKARAENAVADSADSNTLNITTDAPPVSFSVPADFALSISDGQDNQSDTNTSAEIQVSLTNGSGNTTIQCQQPDHAGSGGTVPRLQVRAGTSSGVYSSGTFQNSVTLSNSANYFMIFQIQENGDNNNYPNDGSGLTQDRTITFTNSGVSNTDLQIAISVVNR
tara:strand:- start:44 stop:1330 length:1287 start_codon:yes stop_codon:yes gene_type:complete